MTHAERLPAQDAQLVAHRLDAAVWGVFFVWVGIALFANFGWGLALLGVGAITLGGQIARRSFGLDVEGFWLVVGVLFVLGGVWQLLSVQFSLIPLLLIVAGVALLFGALRGKKA